MRRPSRVNPLLIGAATVLVVVVAVLLAYNANNGLPFVPGYTLKVDVPDAANLVRGNDVRIGGARVGSITKIVPKHRDDGTAYAQLTVKLHSDQDPLPVDSTFLVRPRSVLGLKYLQITKGRASRGLQDGATVPLSQARPTPVEFDDVENMFDEPTRAAAQTQLDELGAALAGRGQDLNRAIEELDPLLTNLAPVMGNLADPATRLGGLITALERTARVVAPVAQQQADLFVGLDQTFGGLDAVRPQLADSIEGAPPALEAATVELPRQRPFLANAAGLFRELRPGVAALRTAAPDLAEAATNGTRSLRRSIALNERLIPTFEALERFARNPLSTLGIEDLTTTSGILAPTVHHLAPAQTVCNYLTLWFRNIASLLSDGDTNGTWQRFMVIVAPAGPNNEGGPASKPAAGPGRDNYLHTNPYPNTAAPGQPDECEAGNETYLPGQTVIGNEPGVQAKTTETTKREDVG